MFEELTQVNFLQLFFVSFFLRRLARPRHRLGVFFGLAKVAGLALSEVAFGLCLVLFFAQVLHVARVVGPAIH